MNARSIDWAGGALTTIAVALATLGAFVFGRRYDQFQAVLVLLIFLLGLAGVYY